MAMILANENFPLASVRLLRDAGHDVIAITETLQGITDTTVLDMASRQGRILLTFDRDYGELVFLRNLPCPPAIVLLRFDPITPDEAGIMITALLSSNLEQIIGRFIVLDRDHIRARPLPL
ncbi:MAG TPA: DUF5615 family PIN-like protein [Geobacteraceae bacterium]